MPDDRSASRSAQDHPVITPELLLRAYAAGYFPMAEHADSPDLFWVTPRERGLLPLDGLHLSKSLIKTLRSGCFEARVDHDFEAVITACAKTRPDTWINGRIHALYSELFEMGHVHTVECYAQGRLVGGLYGLALGGVFFGESMFHMIRDASKVALAHLVARLREGGFVLLDTQFVTPHLARMGAITLERMLYMEKLQSALDLEGDFFIWPQHERDDPRKVLDILQSPWLSPHKS
jgi:leucyl/phenylalanyl-tRNA--protein transferase